MKQLNSKKAKVYYATDPKLRLGKKDRDKTAFVYVRISREDDLGAESNSIQNQIQLLKQLAQEYGYTIVVIFLDDGITGVTAKRPGFQDMLSKLERQYAAALFVKDLSRLYRNRTEANKLVDDFLPENEVRLVSVGDSIDSSVGDDELIFLRNWANEQYAKDISKKRRLSNRVRGNAGEPLSPPPYGYMKDPDNPKRWVVDEAAAAVVNRIYTMTLAGMGIEQIATTLQSEEVMTPMHYKAKKGIRQGGSKSKKGLYEWNYSTVSKILSLQEYCGDVINFKTYSKSYKNKTRIENVPENILVFQNVHEPIIKRDVWELVQQRRGKIRKRLQKNGEYNMFSGLLFCVDCGGKLNFHFNQKNREIQYFNCSNNNRSRKTCPTTHHIRVDFLEQVVLGEIRRLTRFASHSEDDFAKLVMGHSKKALETECKLMEKEVADMKACCKELDILFERIYEDNASGKISEERFAKMSAKYEQEQVDLNDKVKNLLPKIERATDKNITADSFLFTVRKYTRAKKLTSHMLSELIDRIEVHQSEKKDGIHVQQLTIHYNCVGVFNPPDIFPTPDVQIQTRKGVVVSYSA